MWGKASFRTRKPSSDIPVLTDSRVHQPSTVNNHKRDISAKALPTLPLSPGFSSQFTSYQLEPNQRAPSSIYSRDTVNFDHHRQRSISDTHQFPPQLDPPDSANGHAQGTRSVDISPPDSPIKTPNSRDSARVSPIEDDPLQASGLKFSSQIPVPRKRADSKLDQPLNPLSKANATKWDNFSGEPTTSNHGRFGQVNPGNVSFETHVSAPRQRSNSSKLMDWGKEHLHSRKKTSESRNRFYAGEATPFVHREPWRGQSGRSPMVYPIQEKPRNRSSSRLHFSRSSDRLREMNTPSPIVGSSGTFTTIITAGEQNHRQQPQPRPRPQGPYGHDAPQSRNASAVSVTSTAPPRVDLVSSPDLSASLTDLTLADDEYNEPTSRFSVTTYGTTEVESSTPSPRNSITPSPPPSIIETASQRSTDTTRSIMSRSRPVPSAIAPGKRPVRKPTPSEISNKALPPNPAEMTVQGRIDMLEAKRAELVRRKANISTMINELTQVIQPSSIAYDMAAREEVKKTVASLNSELADIQKEEHDIGLKLLRAWKKRDDGDFYGASSSLWVKRVTS
ncbi:uncharacterized protein DSM5745_03018 [Aspergillus mulundensis]|uniref:Uncharacterized protein n=1 Tax=Aspergillus mulundensis TaxID=1810919 RepID=A0A3D8SJB6_9EURO|nr:Uncharacterized protein DSM5745_03018 [Aspergillus mulundensis]RDW86376.1 Uncharacterized protein DSM5745_03018 [Aspergillus mulundensis]